MKIIVAGLLAAILASSGEAAAGVCDDMASAVKQGAPFPLHPAFFPPVKAEQVDLADNATTWPVNGLLAPDRERLLAEAGDANSRSVLAYVLARTGKDGREADELAYAYRQSVTGNLIAVTALGGDGCCGSERWAFLYRDAAGRLHVAAPPAYIGDRDLDGANNDSAVVTLFGGKPVFVESSLDYVHGAAGMRDRMTVTPWLGDHFGASCGIDVLAVSKFDLDGPDHPPAGEETVVRGHMASWANAYFAFYDLDTAGRKAQAERLAARLDGDLMTAAEVRGMRMALESKVDTKPDADQVVIPEVEGGKLYLAVVGPQNLDNDNTNLVDLVVYPSALRFGLGPADGYTIRETPVSVKSVNVLAMIAPPAN